MMQFAQFFVHSFEYLQNKTSLSSGSMACLIFVNASSSVKALTPKLKFDVLLLSTGCNSVIA
jgi:hypothetical protein